MSTGAVRAEPLGTPEMTIEQWADMDEDEPGELVDGQLVEEEVPDYTHETVVAWLVVMIGGWLLAHGGRVAASDAKFAVSSKGGRKPDVSIYLPGSPPPPSHGVVRVPPDIMIEVISRKPRDVRRDRIDKALEYAAFGVRYYWLIQPSARTVEIYELQPSGAYLRIVAASGGTIGVPGCPDLRIDRDAMWAHVAGLGPPTPPPSKVTRLRKTAKK
jgi:Uma2 family endonuclease